MSTLDAVIGRLERIRTGVSRPELFYRDVQRDWTQLARRSVEATLVAMQPPDVDSTQWLAKITEISQRVVTEFYDDETESGISFTIGARVGTEEPVSTHGFTLDNISIQDVVKWVEAGFEKDSPDQPGKNLDERDANKTPLQIAWRIMYALKLRKPRWDRLMNVLREFVGVEAEEAADAIYPELLKTWLEFFSVRAPAAWREYIHGLLGNAPF